MSFGTPKNFRGTSIPSLQTGLVASASTSISDAKRISDGIRFGNKQVVAAVKGPIMSSGPATPTMSDAVKSLMPDVNQFTASSHFQSMDSWRAPLGVGPTWSPEHDTRDFKVSSSQIPCGAGIVTGMMGAGVISSTDTRSTRPFGAAPIGYQGDIGVHMEALQKKKAEIVQEKQEAVTQVKEKLSAAQKIEESIKNTKISTKDANKLQDVADKNKQEADTLTKKINKLDTEEKKVDQEIVETAAKQPQPIVHRGLPPVGHQTRVSPFAPNMGAGALEKPDPSIMEPARFTASAISPYNPSMMIGGQDTTAPSPSERGDRTFGAYGAYAAAQVASFGAGMKGWFQGFWKKN